MPIKSVLCRGAAIFSLERLSMAAAHQLSGRKLRGEGERHARLDFFFTEALGQVQVLEMETDETKVAIPKPKLQCSPDVLC